MAKRAASARRQTSRSSQTEVRQMYVYGNTVPKPEYKPRHRRPREKQPEKVSRQVRRNRRKALHMSKGYVIFLAVAAVLALAVCVNYVMLQSKITSRSKNITRMQSELATLKEENNTKYNVVMDSVNLEQIREKAVNELGMVNAVPEQIVEYTDPASSYVKQYEQIPEDGVLAGSGKVDK